MKHLFTLMCICCLATTALAGDFFTPKQPMSKEEMAQAIAGRKPFINSLGMEFVWIEPGEFVFGLEGFGETEEFEFDDADRITSETIFENPERFFIKKGFYLQKYEATEAQIQQIFPEITQNTFYLGMIVQFQTAREFANTLTKQENSFGKYRLPMVWEWEYACKAGRTPPVRKHGHVFEDTIHENPKFGNPWGIHDMTDDVQEWVETTQTIDQKYQPSRYQKYNHHHNTRDNKTFGMDSTFAQCANIVRMDASADAAIRLVFQPRD